MFTWLRPTNCSENDSRSADFLPSTHETENEGPMRISCGKQLVLLFACFTAFSACTLLVTSLARAAEPKWFVRESVGKGERELTSGEIGLKLLTEKTSVTIFTAILESGGTEQNESGDDCNKSLVEGVKIVGGTPAKIKFKKLILTGCEEAFSENCKISSSTEEAKLENVTGELVYIKPGDVGVLIKFPAFSFKMTCKTRCPKMGTENFASATISQLSGGYSEEVEQTLSPIISEYLSNPKEEKAVLSSTGSGYFSAERVKFEGKITGLSEGGVESKEIKAE